MPTINEVIERVDKIKPNTYDEQTKATWLYRVDGRISAEIMKQDPPQEYIYPEDADKELLVPHPYDNLYDFYLQAMIDYTNKEYGNYNNSMIMYNEVIESFSKKYIRDNMPKSASNFRNVI